MRIFRVRLALVFLWALALLPVLPARELMPPDEPRFGEVAREMREGGHWIVPRLAGRVYADKPPLLFWAMNLASLPTGGITATTARIPSALASLAMLLLTLRLGRRLFGSPLDGLAGVSVLLTTSEFYQRSQWASTDMLLAAFSLTAGVLWSEALFARAAADAARDPLVSSAGWGGSASDGTSHGDTTRGGTRSDNWMIDSARGRMLLGWVAASLATLTKGPVGLFWALAWPAAEGVARGRWKDAGRIFRSWGVPVFLTVVGGWLIAAERITGGGFIREVILHQSVERYVAAWNNQQPWYFFLYQLPLDLAPWSVFIPAAAGMLWLRSVRPGPKSPEPESPAHKSPRRQSGPELEDEGRTLGACALFLLAALLVFSASTGKRGVYLLPAFPIASLLLGRAFLGAGRTGWPGRAWREVPLALLAVLGAAAALGAPLAALEPGISSRLSGLLQARGVQATALAGVCGAGLALAFGSAGALVAAKRMRPRLALSALFSGLFFLFLLAGTVGGTLGSCHQGASAFGKKLAARVPAGCPIAIERGKFELILFYSRREGFEFRTPGELTQALEEGRATYALIERPTFERLLGAPALARREVLLRGSISDTEYVLVGPPVLARVLQSW